MAIKSIHAIFCILLLFLISSFGALSRPENYTIDKNGSLQTLCDSTAEVDFKADRTPNEITHIKCTGCRDNCPPGHRCTQFLTVLNVYNWTIYEMELIDVYSGCACREIKTIRAQEKKVRVTN